MRKVFQVYGLKIKYILVIVWTINNSVIANEYFNVNFKDKFAQITIVWKEFVRCRVFKIPNPQILNVEFQELVICFEISICVSTTYHTRNIICYFDRW